MSLPIKAINNLLGYNSGTFGYREINMNARYVAPDTTYLAAGTRFVPPVTSRNNEQWNQVEVDSDVYTYNQTMLFPLPFHHLQINTIEIEMMVDGLYKPPSGNSSITIRFELCHKVDGEWVSTAAQSVHEGIYHDPNGASYQHRILSFAKFFYNWNTGYDVEQYIVRPIIIYDDNEFRIDSAFISVKILGNSVN